MLLDNVNYLECFQKTAPRFSSLKLYQETHLFSINTTITHCSHLLSGKLLIPEKNQAFFSVGQTSELISCLAFKPIPLMVLSSKTDAGILDKGCR